MAKVNIKCFGVLRLDSKIEKADIEVDTVSGIFEKVNGLIEGDFKIEFNDALIYINGERCTSKNKKLNDGDEVWLLSPASGG